MKDTSQKGHLAETLVLSELVKRDFNVSIPFGSYRYDMIAEKKGRFNRIQVKYISWETRRKTIRILLHSITRNGRKKYLPDEIDHIIAYYEPEGKFYIVPVNDVKGKATLELRMSRPANNQSAKVTFAKKYEGRWDLLF